MDTMSIKRRPRHQLVKLLRDVGVTQAEIAGRVGVTQSFVSRVLSRTASVRPTTTTEAVWREVEKAIGHLVR
jgi:predicted transcriptional regulator